MEIKPTRNYIVYVSHTIDKLDFLYWYCPGWYASIHKGKGNLSYFSTYYHEEKEKPANAIWLSEPYGVLHL